MTLHLAILRSASLLVPGPHRAEWFAEWTAELWHVNRGATAFCLGAFRDAFWLRRNTPTPIGGIRSACVRPCPASYSWPPWRQ